MQFVASQTAWVAGTVSIGIWKTVQWCGLDILKGRRRKTSIRPEAIAYGELWIWGFHFGKPGILNDINMLDRSPLVNFILHENMLPEFEFASTTKRINSCIFYFMESICTKHFLFRPFLKKKMKRCRAHFRCIDVKVGTSFESLYALGTL